MHFGDNIGVRFEHNLEEIMLFVIEDYVIMWHFSSGQGCASHCFEKQIQFGNYGRWS